MALIIALLIASGVLLVLGITHHAFWFDYGAFACASIAASWAISGLWADA